MFGVFDGRGLETLKHLSSAECEGSSCPTIQLQLSPGASTMGRMALGEFMLTLIINPIVPYSQPLKGSSLSDSQGLPKGVWYRSSPRALMFWLLGALPLAPQYKKQPSLCSQRSSPGACGILMPLVSPSEQLLSRREQQLVLGSADGRLLSVLQDLDQCWLSWGGARNDGAGWKGLTL